MEEEILIPIIVFSFILSLIWMILNHNKWRYKQKQEAKQAASNSLGTSELKALMLEAVVEANMPLVERIETLEAELRQATAPRLGPAQHNPMVEELRQTPEEAPEPAERRGVT